MRWGLVRRYLDRILWAAAGFLVASVLGHAALIQTTDGQVWGASELSAGAVDREQDVVVLSGTFPTALTKLQPGLGVVERRQDTSWTDTIKLYPGADSFYYWRRQDIDNDGNVDWYRLFVDNTSATAYTLKWQEQVDGGAPTDLATSASQTIASGSSTREVLEVVVTFSGSTTTLSVYRRETDPGVGSVTTLIDAATDTLPAGWGVGDKYIESADGSMAWNYLIWSRGNTVRVTDLPSNRKVVVCDPSNTYLGKLTAAADTLTVGSAAILPIQGRLKVKTDTDADDCTTGTIHETLYTHSLIGGTVYEYRDKALVAGPTVGIPYMNGATFDVKLWGLFNAAGSMKVGYKTATASWPGTACTGTETCTAELATTATNYFHRAYVTVAGLSASTTYTARLYHCVASVCTVQDDDGDLTLAVPASDTTTGTFTLCASSCHAAQRRAFILWATMVTYGCDVTVFLGDWFYEGTHVGGYAGAATPVPPWEPIADTRAEYEIKYLDVLASPDLRTYFRTHAIGFMHDDHEYCNGATPTLLRCNGLVMPSQMFTDAEAALDDFLMGINPPALRAGTRYWAMTRAKTYLPVPDHIKYHDDQFAYDHIAYGHSPTNMVTNGDFEAGTLANWTQITGTWSASASSPYAGSYSALTPSGTAVAELRSDDVAVTSGTTYLLEATFGVGGAFGELAHVNINGQTGCTLNAAANSESTPITQACEWTASATGNINVNLIKDASAAVRTAKFDGVRLVPINQLASVTGTATNGGSTITCAACDFTAASVAADDRALFEARWYRITSKDSATVVSVSPAIACTTCTSRPLKIVTRIKSMLGTQQFVDFTQALQDTTATTVVHLFSKALYYTRNDDTWGVRGCTPNVQAVQCAKRGEENGSGYYHELLAYRNVACDDSTAGSNDTWVTGDSHVNYEVLHTDLAGCTQREVQVGGLGIPGPGSSIEAVYGDSMANHTLTSVVYGRSFVRVQVDTTASPDTVTYALIGENGDELLKGGTSTALHGSGTLVYPAHSAATAVRNQTRIVRHSSGRCVVIAYDGVQQEVQLTGPDCEANPATLATANIGTTTLDRLNVTGDLAINGNTVYLVYTEGATDADDYKLKVRTATVDAGAGTIVVNADAITLADVTVNSYLTTTVMVRGSDGYLYVATRQLNQTNNNVSTVAYRSNAADTIGTNNAASGGTSSDWTRTNIDIGETTEKGATLIATGGGKVLLVYRFGATASSVALKWNEWTGSAWCFASDLSPDAVASGVDLTNSATPRGAGDGSGGALVPYMTGTGPGTLRVIRFTSNATCANGTWGSAITLAAPEGLWNQSVVNASGRYYVLAHNALNGAYLWSSGNEAPSGSGDFTSATWSIPRHWKLGRMVGVADGTDKIQVVYEASNEPNGTAANGRVLRVHTQEAFARVPWWVYDLDEPEMLYGP